GKHAEEDVHAGADRGEAAPDRSAAKPGQDGTAGLQRKRHRRSDLLSLAQRIRRAAVGTSQKAEGSAKRKCSAQARLGHTHAGKAGFEGHCRGKLLSPVRRRLAVQHARDKGVTERHACRLVGQWRTTQRYQPTQSNDEDRLTQSILALASQYGRFGYRRITALLKQAGWKVGKDRVQRIWRREGLKVPTKHKPRGRLWLNDGSCVRLRPERPNHVWSYDFVQDRTEDGRAFRMLVVLDEFTRRCLAILVARRLRSDDVLHCLADLFVTHGPPEHIRSDNGPEFVAINVRDWLGRIGVKTLYIEPGSPWENGYCESLNSKLRDELLNGEIFTTMREAQVLIENWRRHYNAIRPHSSLGYRPPAPEAILPPASGLPYAPLRPAQTLADDGRVLT